MVKSNRILLIGTADTKAPELEILRGEIVAHGAECLLMDVGVMGKHELRVDITGEDVAAAAGMTLEEVRALGNEHEAMNLMADGASRIAEKLTENEGISATLIIGGTMGTDLALQVASALPLGISKVILSTVAFSPIIPTDRLSSDLIMISWTGGLWGLSTASLSIMRQAAATAVAAGSVNKGKLEFDRPVVALSSLGTSALRYMPVLKPAIEERGFEVVVFHAVGIGGRTLEHFAEQGRLVAVFDLCMIEMGNFVLGSPAHAGEDRLEAAGKRGIPQIISPGALDGTDVTTWSERGQNPDRVFHIHNRLVGEIATNAEEKVQVARLIAEKLNKAKGPVEFVDPTLGYSEWDREGAPLYDPEGRALFSAELQDSLRDSIKYHAVDAHINDLAFVEKGMEIFDRWLAEGIIEDPLKNTANLKAV